MRRAPRSGSVAFSCILRGRTCATVTFLLSLGAARALVAQEMPAAIDRQVTLLTRIVHFDRSLPERARDEVVVALLYEKGSAASVLAHDRIRARLALEPTLARRPLRIVSIEWEADRSPLQALSDAGASFLYVAPLEHRDIRDVIEATRQLDILSVTGVPGYVAQGVSIGFEAFGAHREILVNLDASREEGARLSSELLRLSRVLTASQKD